MDHGAPGANAAQLLDCLLPGHRSCSAITPVKQDKCAIGKDRGEASAPRYIDSGYVLISEYINKYYLFYV